MSLSAKFAQLKKVQSNPSNNNGPRARVQQSAASQQAKRAAQSQARRTGAPVQKVQNNNKGKAANKPSRNGKPILNGVKKNLRKNAGKGRPGSAGKKGGKAGDKKEKKTGADLDKDMDQYWFAAGKGPNPEVLALDNDLDAYQQKRGTATTASAAEPAVMSE